MRHKLEPLSCKESNEDDTKETLQTNKQRALTSLQLVYSCAFTCLRFASTLDMLLCLLFFFVSLIQSSSVFPRIHFSLVSEFVVEIHVAKTGLLRCCLCSLFMCHVLKFHSVGISLMRNIDISYSQAMVFFFVPDTRLTWRRFSESYSTNRSQDITSGFPRLVCLFENPKNSESCETQPI